MKTQHEIFEKLQNLHGSKVRKDFGGDYALTQAETLLWVLGFDIETNNKFNLTESPIITTNDEGHYVVDVSDYIHIEKE